MVCKGITSNLRSNSPKVSVNILYEFACLKGAFEFWGRLIGRESQTEPIVEFCF